MYFRARKALVCVVVAAMLLAAGIIVYTSKQVAAARESGDTHAARTNKAIEQFERMIDNR